MINKMYLLVKVRLFQDLKLIIIIHLARIVW